MKVCLPFCEKDSESAIRLLSWIGDLGGCPGHELILIAARACDPHKRAAVFSAAEGKFGSIERFMASTADERGWPYSANTLFRAACTYAQSKREPWLWLEPDCTPLKTGWLDDIEREYKQNRKPFMGFVWDTPKKHLTGCAVYPHNVRELNPGMLNPGHLPFDVVTPHLTLRGTHVTGLIQHVWGDIKNNIAPTFPDRDSLGILSAEAVLFHRCKDGSLIERLKESRNGHAVKTVPTKPDNHWFKKIFSQVGRKDSDAMPAFVQLGRVGDILNILPIVRLFNAILNHRKVPMVVHNTMAHCLDRCGYVTPVLWNGPITDRDGASKRAAQLSEKVMVPQLFHDSVVDHCGMEHYNLDQWEECGCMSKWGTLPLEIDCRDWVAEKKIFNSVCQTERPLICYNLSSISSPFKYAPDFEKWLHANFGDCELVDLNKYRLECFTDQLAVLDRCHALVTIDTATLHLAQASHCPYVALLSDLDPSGWKATQVRRPSALSVNYREWERTSSKLQSVLRSLADKTYANSTIWHCISGRLTTDPRLERVRRHWDRQYSSGQTKSLNIDSPKRNAAAVLGDKRDLPFIRDVLLTALIYVQDPDIIMLTNDDVVVSDWALDQLRLKLRYVPMVTASRVDLRGQMPPVLAPDAQWDISRGSRHLGRDLFAFNAGWLRQNMWRIPDFVLGASEFDLCLLGIARKQVGIPTTAENLGLVFPECELLPGSVLHEKHEAYWSRPDNYSAAPSQIHNSTLCEEWFRENEVGVQMKWFSRI